MQLEGIYLTGYSHAGARDWYKQSLTNTYASKFNGGVVGGAYWSVVGPGKNLQLTSEHIGYFFRLNNSSQSLALSDIETHPGRLPEPVVLRIWANLSDLSGDIDGVVLSCDESENAAGYQVLMGSDPYRVAHYQIISDTALPPMDIVKDLPSKETWWTVRVRDRYGSTIYADPIRLDSANLPPLSVTNARTGKKYGLITHALLDGETGDAIVLDPVVYEENVEFGETAMVISSRDPEDPAVVAATIIKGRPGNPTVAFSGPKSSGCMLVGLTIQSDSVGISCRDAVPTIRSCMVESPSGIAVEFWHGRTPEFVDCRFVGQIREGGDPGLIAYWKLDEAVGTIAHDSEGTKHAEVMGTLRWQPEEGIMGGTLEFGGFGNLATAEVIRDPSAGPVSVFAWVKGGAPGQVIASQQGAANWLMAGFPNGTLATELVLRYA